MTPIVIPTSSIGVVVGSGVTVGVGEGVGMGVGSNVSVGAGDGIAVGEGVGVGTGEGVPSSSQAETNGTTINRATNAKIIVLLRIVTVSPPFVN